MKKKEKKREKNCSSYTWTNSPIWKPSKECTSHAGVTFPEHRFKVLTKTNEYRKGQVANFSKNYFSCTSALMYKHNASCLNSIRQLWSIISIYSSIYFHLVLSIYQIIQLQYLRFSRQNCSWLRLMKPKTSPTSTIQF